jgi:hypothetical protein
MIHGLQTALPKLAVLDIYLYIFPEKWSRWTLMATAVVVAANGLVYIPTTIWQCNPINAAWDYSIKGATCNNVKLHYSFLGLPHILTDLVMLIVPIPIIARLQMDRTIKAGVMATFLSGSMYDSSIPTSNRIILISKVVDWWHPLSDSPSFSNGLQPQTATPRLPYPRRLKHCPISSQLVS